MSTFNSKVLALLLFISMLFLSFVAQRAYRSQRDAPLGSKISSKEDDISVIDYDHAFVQRLHEAVEASETFRRK